MPAQRGTLLLESEVAKFTLSSLLVFVLGASVPIPLELVGVAYLGELLLFLVAAWAVAVNIQNPWFWSRAVLLPIGCLAVTFLGYALSDLINNTGLSNLLRGWARIIFLGTNILAVYFLCRKKTFNLLIFCLGISATTASFQSGRDFYFNYKLGIALPLTLLVVCLGALVRSRGRYLLISAALASVGVLHILMDFRSLGAICLLAGAIVFSKTTERSRVRGLYAALLITAIAVGTGVLSYSYYSTQDAYSHRRRESDNWRLAAGTAALDSIRRAPVFGNGSWATSSQMLTIFDASYTQAAGRRPMGRVGMELAGHSQFLQAWYEAGVLGTVFFLYFGYSLGHALWICIFRAPLDPLIPLAILSCWLSLYNIGFSPFAGGHRIHMAISVVIAETVRRNWQNFARVKRHSMGMLQFAANYPAVPATEMAS